MQCQEWQELILERERLTPSESQQLDGHLASCAGCRRWADALTEVESVLAAEFRAGLDASALHRRITRAVTREQIWTKGLPEALDALGWTALAVLVMAGLLLSTNGFGWYFWLAGAVTLSASLAWAARVYRTSR